MDSAGRFCPADYRIAPSWFTRPASPPVDVLYVAGGLYGNPFALTAIEQMFAAEASERKALVFNGDFHWFDHSPDWFVDIERRTRPYRRLRGNVETELSRGGLTDAGCGCAYPESVSDQEVYWSNQIIAQLAVTAREALGDVGLAELGNLSPAGRWQVGDTAVGITHGDHESLAGWSLAHNRLRETWRSGLAGVLDDWRLDILASSHTCLPVAGTAGPYSPHPARPGAPAVINNGAAGLPNFRHDLRGLVTRIALVCADPPPVAPCYSALVRDCSVMALPVEFDQTAWRQRFLSVWPRGSAAHESYWQRLTEGPDFGIGQAIGDGFVLNPEHMPSDLAPSHAFPGEALFPTHRIHS